MSPAQDIPLPGIPERGASPASAARHPVAGGARLPLFCDIALAGRIERAEAQLITAASAAAARRAGDGSGFVIPVAGGVASFAEADSPFSKVAGLGFGGVPDAVALAEIEQAFAARGAATQVELAHLADPGIGALLTSRGYQLVSFENVLGRAVPSDLRLDAPPGIEVRASGDDEFGSWLDVQIEGTAHPDTEGLPSHEEFPGLAIARAERDLAAAGVTRYAALRDGVMAGGASMRITGGIAQFTGAATAPAHRRRGIQAALLSARLADAAAAGCDVAVVTTQPASKSHQNVQRQGFDLLYTRAILVRQPLSRPGVSRRPGQPGWPQPPSGDVASGRQRTSSERGSRS